MLRLKAAELGIASGGMTLVNELSTFLAGGKTDAELDAMGKRPAADAGAAQRNEFINATPSNLALPGDALKKLRGHGISTIGALAQWQRYQLRDHAMLTSTDIDVVESALSNHGLRLGMSGEQMKDWIVHGKDPGAK